MLYRQRILVSVSALDVFHHESEWMNEWKRGKHDPLDTLGRAYPRMNVDGLECSAGQACDWATAVLPGLTWAFAELKMGSSKSSINGILGIEVISEDGVGTGACSPRKCKKTRKRRGDEWDRYYQNEWIQLALLYLCSYSLYFYI